MTRVSRNRSTVPFIVLCVLLGLVLTGGFAVGASRYLVSFGWPALAALVVVAIGVPAALLVPAHWLPALALAAFTLVPNRITPDGYTLRIPIWGFLIGVWVLRRLLDRSRPIGERDRAPWRSLVLGWRVLAYAAALAFTAWAALTTLRSDQVDTGFGWLGSIVVCVFLPLLVLDGRREAELLRSTWVIGGALIGVYAVGELLLQSSPLYGTLYEIMGVGDVQHWSLHRAEGSFGHPLLAGTYLAIAAVLGIASWLDTRRLRDLVGGAIAAAGVVATVSRSSMLAMAIAVAVALVAWVFVNPDRPTGKPVLFGIVGLLAAIAVLNSAPITARSDSLESERSADARTTAIGVALRGAEASGWLGTGPGTSGVTGRLFDQVTIENSALQLLLSVGIPGLVLFTLFLAGVAFTALAARDVAAAAALLAYGVCIIGYNAIDAVRATHLLLGFLVIICLNPRPSGLLPRGLADTASRGEREPVTARLTGDLR